MTVTGCWRSSPATGFGFSAAAIGLVPRTLPAAAPGGLPALALDGEIAVPDECGVTHIDTLSEAISGRRPEQFAYFAFDLLYLDGHDLRRCAIEDRKVLLRDVVGAARCERIVDVDHVLPIGRELFEAARQVGVEGIVLEAPRQIYRGGESRDWLKPKVLEVGRFVITGFAELGPSRLEPGRSDRNSPQKGLSAHFIAARSLVAGSTMPVAYSGDRADGAARRHGNRQSAWPGAR
jgi:hypothetical protein